MRWIRKRLLEILCVMIYFTVNPLSTSGLRPLRLCHLLSAPNSRSTGENNKASHGATQSQKKRWTHSFLLRKFGDLNISVPKGLFTWWWGGPHIGGVTCFAVHPTYLVNVIKLK